MWSGGDVEKGVRKGNAADCSIYFSKSSWPFDSHLPFPFYPWHFVSNNVV